MTHALQQLLIYPIVGIAAIYAAWILAPRSWRGGVLRHLLQALQAVPGMTSVCRALQRSIAANHAHGSCASCDKNATLPALFLVACAVVSSVSARAAAITVTDDTGVAIALAAPAARIVSLSPGATELLFVAGAGTKVVATVQAADEPVAAKKIRRIGDANKIDYGALLAAKPDVVVVWHDLTNKRVLEDLGKLKLPIYSVNVAHFGDFAESVRRLGVLAGTTAAAEAEAAALAKRATQLEKRKFKGTPLRVFYMVWDVPLYTVGGRHLMSEALAHCGAHNIFEDIDFPSPVVEFKNVVSANPEVILMSTTPITARDWRERWAPYTNVRAVETKQVITYEDVRLDRMGPTAFDALPGLCEKLAVARAEIQSRKFSN